LDFAGIVPEAKFDGTSLVPCLHDGKGNEDRTLLFFGGWHVGVNFACGVQRRVSDGHRYLYAYNCTSTFDELYDLDSIDAVNLIDSSEHQHIRKELINLLGSALQADPRWAGYWSEFRIAHFKELPEKAGDMQLFTTSA
jgi:hypothetical protein